MNKIPSEKDLAQVVLSYESLQTHADPACWFPETRAEAKKYKMPVFRDQDGLLWRVASSKKSTRMDNYRDWKLRKDATQKEIQRVSNDVETLNRFSAKQLVEQNRIADLPKGSAAARQSGSRHFQSEQGPCKHGHPPIRVITGKQTACAFCKKIAKRQYHDHKYKTDPDYRDKLIQKNEEYRSKNIDEVREKDRLRDKTPKRRLYNKIRKHRNRKRLKAATPPWLTFEHLSAIDYFYGEAIRLTEETGVAHEVDHIEPLNGVDRCGLHVPWNLRVITKEENMKKSNKTLA